MREALKRLATSAFLAGDRVGVHVLPAHYYSPIASRRGLRATEDMWRRPLDPIAFAWDLDAQAAWVVETADEYPQELPLDELMSASEAVGGFRFGPIEAQFLYSYIRTAAPKRIVEIGSGSSTLVMSRAVQRNVGAQRPPSEIIACDPYTAHRVAGLPHVTAREIGGYSVDDEVLALEAGDLLFIDSTHTVRTGSELSHMYLELIPMLQPGVVLHIHDIYLPYLFPPNLYNSMFDWQETTLVAALLTSNQHLVVRASMAALHYDRPEALRSAFPEYLPRRMENGMGPDDQSHFPSSLWLEAR